MLGPEFDDFSQRTTQSRLKYGLAMDGVLVLLGGGTIWLATQYLSFDDPRPSQNAWTYIIGVPLGLILVDLVFRTVVSRFIERSLQVAFLLSMLVHLFLTMGAIHTRIFARGETELAQSLTLAAARQEKQSSVPEYFQMTESKSVDKPDYLKPVETRSSEAAELDSEKQNIEDPVPLPTPVEIPDKAIEMREAEIQKVDKPEELPEVDSRELHR